MQQLVLFDIGIASPKTRPGSGALRLYWFMRGISCGKPYCYPKQKFLQDKMRRTRQTIYRWIKELIDFGLIEIVRRGREGISNLYRFTDVALGNFRNGTKNVTSTRSVPIVQSTTRPPSGGDRTPQLAPQVAEYFGNTELGGKQADPALIARVARLIRDTNGLERLKDYFTRWMKRNRPEGWGIFVRLAEDAARIAIPIQPIPPPRIPPQRETRIRPEKLEAYRELCRRKGVACPV